ncbi:MAG: 50S ribosomal protein L24 [bacterium]
MKIRKEDMVMVISGNYKGETGRVLEVYPKIQRVLIEGINLRKKHTRPSQQNQKGGILSKELPIHISNVMLVDSDKNITKVGFRKEEIDGKTTLVRFAKTNDKKI